MKKFAAWLFGCKPEHLKYQIVAFFIIGACLFAFATAAYRIANYAVGHRNVDKMIRYAIIRDGINYVGETSIDGKTYRIYVEER